MKEIIENLDKVLESRIRLGVMSILMVNDSADFNTLKQMLDITDGNLASHITSLEKNKYIKIKKKIVGKKMNTAYSATDSGKRAFSNHLNALEQLIKKS
ncbi:MAG: transcriptional regulator [Bacteroidota bacterium]|nr:transcriptional regulator [Bacteroidota bacterium]